MTKVACIGEAMIELSLQGSAGQVGVAGDTLNTAIYLKRAAPEIEIDYITCLGSDPFSDRIDEFIDAQGISTHRIARLPDKSPGLYAITTTDTGERSFTYWRSASAARNLFQTNDGCDFTDLAQYDLLYLSGISLAILPQWVRQELLDWLNQNPVRLAYDSNYRPRLWENAETARSMTQKFWDRSDLCLPSIDDEMALFDETEAQTISRFHALGRQGALKRGEKGPLSLGSSVEATYPPAAKVLDTTAAGDSFNGGYLAAILKGASQSAALMAGHMCASQVVGYRGAIIPLDAPS